MIASCAIRLARKFSARKFSCAKIVCVIIALREDIHARYLSLRASSHREYRFANLVLPGSHDLLPSVITCPRRPVTSVRRHCPLDLLFPRFNAAFAKRSPAYQLFSVWNSLPVIVRSCKTACGFKEALVKHLLST